MKKSLMIAGTLILLFSLWYLVEENDYFRSSFKDLTALEHQEFRRLPNPTKIYISHFGDDDFMFPRQDVDKVKLFENTPFLSSFTFRTLKQESVVHVINFFNDSTNFSWAETTWEKTEAQIVFKFYYQDKVVGKIYADVENGIVETRPFTPNIKFGALTDAGQQKLKQVIEDKSNWK